LLFYDEREREKERKNERELSGRGGKEARKENELRKKKSGR